jgi:uncharacterized protein YbjT (DUF2867 family)
MKLKKTTLIGATGLIGNQLLIMLQDDSSFSELNILVRNSIKVDHPIVRVSIVDFTNEVSSREALGNSDVVFCVLVTTNKKVNGDKIKYHEIDFNIPIDLVKSFLNSGGQQFLIVSSYGANSKSSNFYLSFKGELEDSLSNLKIPSLSIFQPSFLLGRRKEFRLTEVIGKAFMRTISFFPAY